MGESITQSPVSPKEENITDYFHELYAWAIQIGMTYEQYWEYDTHLIQDFIKAEKIRQRKRNNELWLEGIYIRQAIATCLNTKGKDLYPKKPIPLSDEEVEEERENRFIAFKRMLAMKSNKDKN